MSILSSMVAPLVMRKSVHKTTRNKRTSYGYIGCSLVPCDLVPCAYLNTKFIIFKTCWDWIFVQAWLHHWSCEKQCTSHMEQANILWRKEGGCTVIEELFFLILLHLWVQQKLWSIFYSLSTWKPIDGFYSSLRVFCVNKLSDVTLITKCNFRNWPHNGFNQARGI